MGILPLKGQAAFAGNDMAPARHRGPRRGGSQSGARASRIVRHHECRDNLSSAHSGSLSDAATSSNGLHAVSAAEERRKQLAGTLFRRRAADAGDGRALWARRKLLMLDEPSLAWRPISSPIFFVLSANSRQAVSRCCWSTERAGRAADRRSRLLVMEARRIILSDRQRYRANKRVAASYLAFSTKARARFSTLPSPAGKPVQIGRFAGQSG